MEKINLNNYEAFYLDYLEGRLSAEEVAELLLFLEHHPDLKEELDAEAESAFPKPDLSITFPGKAASRKPEINAENRETFFIAAVENELTAQERKELEAFLTEHPGYLREYELYQRTNLAVDKSIVFPGKEKAKREKAFDPASEEVMIAAIEGLLSPIEFEAFKKACAANPQLQSEYSAYQQTNLSPDLSIVYPDKERFKRPERRIVWLPAYTYLAVAASLTLLFMLWFFNRQPQQEFTHPGFANASSVSGAAQFAEGIHPVKEEKSSVVLTAKKKTERVRPQEQQQATAKTVPATYARIESRPEELATNPGEVPVLNLKEVAPLQQTSTPDKPEPASEFVSLGEFAGNAIKTGLGYPAEEPKEKAHPGLQIAKAAARTINRVAGRKIKIREKYDASGELVSYAINTGGLGFGRTVRKTNEENGN